MCISIVYTKLAREIPVLKKIVCDSKRESFPIVPTSSPLAFGSTPESNMAIVTPSPLYFGYFLRNWITPVSCFGTKESPGNFLSTTTPAMIDVRLQTAGSTAFIAVTAFTAVVDVVCIVDVAVKRSRNSTVTVVWHFIIMVWCARKRRIYVRFTSHRF